MNAILTFILVFTTILYSQNSDTISSIKQDTSTHIIVKDSVSQSSNKNQNNINNYWKLFLDFISNPFTSAALASIITLILNNIYNSRKKKKEELLNYKTLLMTTKNELEFYIVKFDQLKTESDDIIKAINKKSSPIIPTYSLYPKFLENSKIGLNKFFKNVNIVKRVGHCHFELSHISERLELLKKELRTAFNPQKEIANIGGFKKLVESNITEFNNTVNVIDSEISKVKA